MRDFRLWLLVVTVVMLSVVVLAPFGAFALTIDFENEPNLPPQPNNFAAAGPMQTYTKPGVYIISGGVVLGNPTFLPAFAAHGTPPNLYGTADFADPSLLSTIRLDLALTAAITSVTGVLFNGQPISEDYDVAAFAGVVPVASQHFSSLPASAASGFANFSLASTLPITLVTITTPHADVNGWDFLVDTIQLTAGAATVPEPSSVLLMLTGVVAYGALRRCKPRRRSRPSPRA
jgi:hypothetical protein